jgi:diaminohydroxyphosphoribosylaminopyrimidine deaminase / 5-amino-6-(5-phosphoribosylamino)uracil reductase
MARAIQLATKGLYTTQPNPRVGCVIVLNGEIVGEGFHQQAGGLHAEVHALKQAGSYAKNATAYVSLEPCSHHGKTPPCANALIAAGISRVVCAMRDPNPLVAGQGIKKLQDAGISVDCGVLKTEAEALNPGFIKRMKSGMPFVRVKLAMSLDGRTAMSSGESKWITGEAARADVQHLRARSSVVLTGSGTVLADDPSMNVRISAKELACSIEPHQPLRAIIDSQLKISIESNIFKQQGECVVFTAVDESQAINLTAAQVVSLPATTGKVDLVKVLQYLAEQQVNEVHVEAGSELCGALLGCQLVDEIVIYMAPHIMGDSAKGLFHLPEIEAMSQRINLHIKEIRQIGKDWRITVLPQYS